MRGEISGNAIVRKYAEECDRRNPPLWVVTLVCVDMRATGPGDDRRAGREDGENGDGDGDPEEVVGAHRLGGGSPEGRGHAPDGGGRLRKYRGGGGDLTPTRRKGDNTWQDARAPPRIA